MRGAREILRDHDSAEAPKEHAPANGGGGGGTRYAEAALVFNRGMRQIEAWGVVVRDLDEGLCDFRARREDREVYLCWRVGEERIEYWHELEAGFPGRRPLDDAS